MITASSLDTFLDEMRGVTDPPADEVVARLFADGGVDRVNALMRQLVENDAPIPPSLPEVARTYFSDTEGLPQWSCPELIEQGEQFFMKHGPHIVAALFLSSLPECYAGAKGAEVLARTAHLLHRPYRRIVETAQFIVDVMQPGGLGPRGAGLRSAQKVRLMHAGVRHLCETRGEWTSEWGRPINQEDLAGTLMTFSTVVLDALHRLGVEVAPEEEAAYFHAWRNVGHLLGVRDELNHESPAQGRELMDVIRRRQQVRSDAGKELTVALLEFLQHVVPGNLLDPVPVHVMRHLVGDRVADMLGVPGMDRLDEGILTAEAALEHLVGLPLRRVPAMSRLVEVFNHKLLEGLLMVTRGRERTPFLIPTSLRGSWGLPIA